jgi:hypothetical protein
MTSFRLRAITERSFHGSSSARDSGSLVSTQLAVRPDDGTRVAG